MKKTDELSAPRTYGPEYGIEAVRRLRAGYPISYRDNGIFIQEYPDGRRFEIRLENDDTTTFLREL
jgi:hypothetical protein